MKTTTKPCPVCGDATSAKFAEGSAWCVRCTMSELRSQAHQDAALMHPVTFQG